MKHESFPQQLTGQILEKELAKSGELIDQFIYSCSHGLRSPIKSMAGLINLIKQCEDKDEDTYEMYLQLLEQSISKIEHIRIQFEEFAGILKRESPIEQISISSALKKIKRAFNPLLQETGSKIICKIDKRGEFYSDAEALHFILAQLVSNAIVFSSPDRKAQTITIFATCSAYCSSLQIHDQGAGIPLNIRDKIFNLFFRGSQYSKGAGVGLYMAREVASKMKGKLSLQSSGELGSVFSLWLPNQSKKDKTSGIS